MPRFRNKRTGLTWEVAGELADRLARDPDYEPEPAVLDKPAPADGAPAQPPAEPAGDPKRSRKRRGA